MLKKIIGITLIFALGISFLFHVLYIQDSTIQPPIKNFTYGIGMDNEPVPENVKLVSGPWIYSEWSQKNTQWLQQFNKPENIDKLPYINTYIVAGLAREDKGLQDCNVGAESNKTLCKEGANYIRNNKQKIYEKYLDSALQIKNIYGMDRPILLHFEPDYYQYQDSEQNNGRLTFEELAGQMNTWTDTVKRILPNARLVMDISPWNIDLQYWSKKFRNFEYGGLVGKRFDPAGDGGTANGVDGKTFQKISELTGKKIIVNDAHGAGGNWLTYNKNWENPRLVSDRYKDGIIAVIQAPTDLVSLQNVSLKTNN
jgi:hypothetical protein